MKIETPLFRVHFYYADDPDGCRVEMWDKNEVLLHWPGLNFLISDEDFHSIKWVVDLVEVTISRVS